MWNAAHSDSDEAQTNRQPQTLLGRPQAGRAESSGGASAEGVRPPPNDGANGAVPTPEILTALSHWAESGAAPRPPPDDSPDPAESPSQADGDQGQDAALLGAPGSALDTRTDLETAEGGFEGSGGAVPHAEAIQRAFGRHQLAGVSAFVGGPAADAADELGATAFASGNRIGFRAAPDLHTAAHEAAHVVQQRAGVHLKGGIGESGDEHERHADSVADRVVKGESAEDLLDRYHGAGHASAASGHAVQLLGDGLGKKQTRTLSVDEYVKLWEKKHHRKMTKVERETLARGCIGITALNLGRGNINPPLDNSFDSFAHAQAFAQQWKRELKKQDPNWFKTKKIVFFSKRFYSKGKDYTPDKKTGRVDMSGYDYSAKPGFVNFDYGFYDEENHTWWHANHSEPDMKVYQSTLKHYSRPLLDFDKQVFCVTWAPKSI